jgi:hypothetical protein
VLDRRLRDEQEERWKAFEILQKLARESRDPQLTHKAVVKILECLTRINTNRFGRVREIRTAISNWSRWLREHPTRTGAGLVSLN